MNLKNLLMVLTSALLSYNATAANSFYFIVDGSQTTSPLYSVTYGTNYFVAVGTNSTTIKSVPGSTNWQRAVSFPATNDSLTAITYGNGMFVAGDTNSQTFTSPDGVLWQTNHLAFVGPPNPPVGGLAYSTNTGSNGIFVAVANGLGVAWASNILNGWNAEIIPGGFRVLNEQDYAVTSLDSYQPTNHIPDGFAMCGPGGMIRVSLSGTNNFNSVETYSSTDPQILYGIAAGPAGPNNIVAVGTTTSGTKCGIVICNTSNVVASFALTNFSNTLNAVTYAGGSFNQFVAVGNGGLILTCSATNCTNPASWIQYTNLPTMTNNLYGITYASGGSMSDTVAIVGDHGTVIIGGGRPTINAAAFTNTVEKICDGGIITNDIIIQGSTGPWSYTLLSNSMSIGNYSTTNSTNLIAVTNVVNQTSTNNYTITNLIDLSTLISANTNAYYYTNQVVVDGPVNAYVVTNQILLCAGVSVYLQGSASGGTPNYTYSWTCTPASGLAYLSSTSIANPLCLPAPGTTNIYTLLVQDSFTNSSGATCPAMTSVTVISDNTLVASVATNSVELCAGVSVYLQGSASGGTTNYTYAWSCVPTNGLAYLSSTNIANPLCSPAPGTTNIYTLLVKDSFINSSGATCPATNSVTVISDKTLIAGVATRQISLCANASSVLLGYASGGTPEYTYSWTCTPASGLAYLSNTNMADPVCSPAPGTTNIYTLLVQDSFTNSSGLACPATTNLTVISDNTLTASVQTNNIFLCAGGYVNLNAFVSGGTPGYTNTWTCVPTSGLAYLSSTSITNPICTPKAGTTNVYTLTVYDSFTNTVGQTCPAMTSVTVITDSNLMASVLTNTIQLCANGSANLDAFVSGGTPGYTTTWTCTPPSGLAYLSSISVTNPVCSPMPGTTNVYVLTVQDSFTNSSGQSCPAMPSVTVISDNALIASVTTNQILLCANTSANLPGFASGGTTNYTYSWTCVPTNGLTYLSSTNIANPLCSPAAGTTNIYTLLVQDSFTNSSGLTCPATTNITVISDYNLMASVATSNIYLCRGGATNLHGSASGGTPGYFYTWTCLPTNGLMYLDNPNTANPLCAPPAGTTNIYTLLVQDSFTNSTSQSCGASSSTTVVVAPVVQAPAVYTNSVVNNCINTTNLPFIVQVPAGVTASWYDTNLVLLTNGTNYIPPVQTRIGTNYYFARAANTATGCASATNTVFTLITLPCLQYSTFSISNVNHTNIYLSWYGSNSLQFTTNLLSTPWVTITNGSPTGTNSNYFYFITNIVTPIDPNTGLGIPGFFRLVTTNY